MGTQFHPRSGGNGLYLINSRQNLAGDLGNASSGPASILHSCCFGKVDSVKGRLQLPALLSLLILSCLPSFPFNFSILSLSLVASSLRMNFL